MEPRDGAALCDATIRSELAFRAGSVHVERARCTELPACTTCGQMLLGEEVTGRNRRSSCAQLILDYSIGEVCAQQSFWRNPAGNTQALGGLQQRTLPAARPGLPLWRVPCWHCWRVLLTSHFTPHSSHLSDSGSGSGSHHLHAHNSLPMLWLGKPPCFARAVGSVKSNGKPLPPLLQQSATHRPTRFLSAATRRG